MAGVCNSIITFAPNCRPTVGGIRSISVKEHGDSEAAVSVAILPESGSLNTVMTYDKSKNLKYWTSDLTFNIGALTASTGTAPSEVQGSAAFVESLAKPIGLDITITLYSGATIAIEDAFIQTATWNDGPTKDANGVGEIKIQAITGAAPTITNPPTPTE